MLNKVRPLVWAEWHLSKQNRWEWGHTCWHLYHQDSTELFIWLSVKLGDRSAIDKFLSRPVLFVCVCVCSHACYWRPEEGINSPGTGVTKVVSPQVDAGIQSQVFCKSRRGNSWRRTVTLLDQLEHHSLPLTVSWLILLHFFTFICWPVWPVFRTKLKITELSSELALPKLFYPELFRIYSLLRFPWWKLPRHPK